MTSRALFRLHKEVEVFGCAGLRMNGNRITTNDQIFKLVFVEGRQEFFEVLSEHRSSGPCIGTAETKALRRRSAAHAQARLAIPGTRHP
jgi:hypothetical protein